MKAETNIFKAVEDLLYELCLLLIFFPYCMFRLLVFPSKTVSDYCEGNAADSLLSPPLFLLATAGLSAVISPITDESGFRLLQGMAALFGSNAFYVLVAQQLAPFLLVAVFHALFLEYLTPGGVTRTSFRKPLFANMLIAAPFMLFYSMADRFMSVATAGIEESAKVSATDGGLLIGALIILIVSFSYYFRSQFLLYRDIAGKGWRIAVPLAVLAIFLTDAVDECLLWIGNAV